MHRIAPPILSLLLAAALHAQAAAQETVVIGPEDLVEVEPSGTGQLFYGTDVAELDDMAIVDADLKPIGEVDEMLAGPDGRIVAVVMETGGMFDIGDVEVIVPLGVLRPAPNGESLQTLLPPEALAELPVWDR